MRFIKEVEKVMRGYHSRGTLCDQPTRKSLFSVRDVSLIINGIFGYFQKLCLHSLSAGHFVSLRSMLLRPLTLVSFLIFYSIAQSSLAAKGKEMREVALEMGPERTSLHPHASAFTKGNTFPPSNTKYHMDQGDSYIEIDDFPQGRGESSQQGAIQNGQPPRPPLNNRFQFMEFPQADYARPTVVMYVLKDASAPGAPTWDIPTQHMYATDRAFFKNPQNLKTLIAGLLGGTIGLIFPATPATGGILWSIGDEMGIPVGSVTSGLLITEIMVTMSPVFARQLYERAQIIERSLKGDAQFPSKQKGAHFDNKPHIYPSASLHTALKGVVGANAVLEGAYYWAIVGLAEGVAYKNITFGMGWGLALALAERYYTVGVRRLDRFFVQYDYSSELVNQHRKILTMQAKKAFNYLGQYPDFVNAVYDTIQDELQYDNTVDSQHFFALGSLFARHSITVRLDQDPLLHDPDLRDEKREEGDPHLEKYPRGSEVSEIINENIDLKREREKLEKEMDDLALEGVKTQVAGALVDQLKPLPKEKLTEYLSIFMTGAGSVSRLYGKQYMFEYIMENIFSIDPTYANIAAWCLAGLHVSMKTVQEYDLQQNYMKSWLNTFSLTHLVDFHYLRKSVNGASFVNGLLFAAANAGPSLAKFSEMSVAPSLQVLTIIPSVVLDVGYIQSYSKENLNEIITAAATTHQATTVTATKRLYPQMQDDLIWKRAKCHDWLNNLLKFLETADEETTELLYRKTQLCS